MKVFLLAPRENWICDRFVAEWCFANKDSVVNNPEEADILWLVGGWCWNQISYDVLEKKPVVLTQHHITPDKLDERSWISRDLFIDAYHVPSLKTQKQVKLLTKKPVNMIPFWANQNIWFQLSKKNKLKLRKKYCGKLKANDYLIGSFQRDTEGSDLVSPKLEKGPDIFCDRVEMLAAEATMHDAHVTVVLAGWRRQYVINRLEAANISYVYYEKATQSIINELYNILDLYLVTSRHEGGPQAIIECALTRTPIISTNVGIASQILSPDSIIGNVVSPTPDVEYAWKSVQPLTLPNGLKPFVQMLNSMLPSS